ncbi:unnamed protein product (macronuclear) [Paramecium tetraurelia]|uniref:Uncharacterized protein n=1 Tax=Paramecium tetraurelia TaxID=5888 RepID=A0C6Z7_PARTE|nr:uncharacterized protein GSPATT00035693001 [Paramecium tetraurelia]CAK66564.1 unnamed protein product [Paramecium tetraurelia]
MSLYCFLQYHSFRQLILLRVSLFKIKLVKGLFLIVIMILTC